MNTPGKACTLWDRRVNSNWKPILSYLKGDKYSGPMFGTDALTSAGSDKNFHHWGQSVSSAFWFIERLQGIVFEPFAGGGTVPAVCKMLGRDYIAFEIDETVAETARGRVEDTPAPLFVLQSEQLNLI